jgi:lipoprotein-releasing system permease protein
VTEVPFEWFVALRYMRDAKGQTALILAGVAVGVSVIVFLSALIGGLQISLIDKTLGAQPHITMRVPREEPRALVESTPSLAIARQFEATSQRLRSIDQWPTVVTAAERVQGVTAASPSIVGAGFAVRSGARRPIVIRGVDPDRFLAIIDLRKRMVTGRFELDGSGVVIGTKLAVDLGATTGDKLRISSSEGIDTIVTVRGTFTLGNEAVDGTWLVTSLRQAQSLFDLAGGVTTIELKVVDVFAAESIATDIRASTGIPADSWMTINAELLAGLSAQSSSKTMIQFFVILAVALGIASVLIVSVVQKSREIGILRAVGTPPQRILRVFLIQGGVLGVSGSVIGCALGTVLAKLFEAIARDPSGAAKFPVQLDASLYIFATLLATGVGLIAATIPARRAARLDPATAIRNG